MFGIAWWIWAILAVVFYVGCLVGANSPQTFKRSKAGLERIANAAAAKARALAQRGK